MSGDAGAALLRGGDGLARPVQPGDGCRYAVGVWTDDARRRNRGLRAVVLAVAATIVLQLPAASAPDAALLKRRAQPPLTR